MFTKLTQRKLLSGSIFFSGSALLFYSISEKKKYEQINWLELKKMAQNDDIKKVELHNSRKAIIYPSRELNTIYHMDISDNNFFFSIKKLMILKIARDVYICFFCFGFL